MGLRCKLVFLKKFKMIEVILFLLLFGFLVKVYVLYMFNIDCVVILVLVRCDKLKFWVSNVFRGNFFDGVKSSYIFFLELFVINSWVEFLLLFILKFEKNYLFINEWNYIIVWMYIDFL